MLTLCLMCRCCCHAAHLPKHAWNSISVGEPSISDYSNLEYSAQPNEILSIQPVLLYPKEPALPTTTQGRSAQIKDTDIIYVKLLKRKGYRPLSRQDLNMKTNLDDTRELSANDIFYVKALANGQFGTQRLKWYRLPEFYAISVFHKA